MPGALLELRPERRLLDHGFEGYKLSLQAPPHRRLPLPARAPRLAPADSQYSLLHARLFALHGHLHADPHHAPLYYVDAAWRVSRLARHARSGDLSAAVVYAIPAPPAPAPGCFNPGLMFPSSSLAVVSDGAGTLHIVAAERGDESLHQWTTLHSELLLGKDNYFVLTDCRVRERDDGTRLDCLVQSVEQSERHFSTVLTWVTFLNPGDSWKVISTKQLKGKGVVHYAAIEPSCSAVYVASDNQFKYVSDSDKEIINNTKQQEEKKNIYTWLQTADDITITMKLPSNYDSTLLDIEVSSLTIKIRYSDKNFIDGALRHKIYSNLTTWNIQGDGKLDILITKCEELMWDELIQGGDRNGEQVLDATLVEEAHRRLAHLCAETEPAPDRSTPAFSTQELEECDAASEEDTVLVRLDSTNHSTTHRIPLSVHQYLFSMNLDLQEAPALVLRHDVDACVWQPYAQLVNSDIWPVKHQGTLKAFGYVQSSKQNKKFVTCSPNFAYSVVCETTKHIFIYKVSNSLSQGCQLRKRGGGESKCINYGQQFVFNIDKYGEVLGVHASNEYLFILTESDYLVLEMI